MAKRCQSCGMPLSKDPMRGGSEADGALSTMYCSFCYDKGAFLHPDFNVAEMQDFCIAQLTSKGMPKVMAWLLTRDIPKLARWRGQ